MNGKSRVSPAPADRVPSVAEGDEGESRKPTQATRLVQLALERYEFVHAPDGEAFALPKGGPLLARDFRGSRLSLRRELAAGYFDLAGSAPSSSATADALATLEGLAARGREIEPALRVGRGPAGELVLDLGHDDGLSAVILSGGWQLKTTPIVFRRTQLTGRLPRPNHPGKVDGLWDLVHVATDDRPLVLGALIAGLFPEIDHPILGFLGEAGSGKSTAARAIVELLDPSPAPLRAVPQSLTDWVVGASGSWIVGVDNLSRIDPWLSDALCRTSSGEGLVRRRLHTDSELAVISLRRFVVLTSIDAGDVLRNDLADRFVVAQLERLAPSERRTERELTTLLAERGADLLGGLLTLISKVLGELPNVEQPELPRLGTFGQIVAALDRVTGTSGLKRLSGLEQRLAEDVLEGDEVALAVLRELDHSARSGLLRGTAGELLERLTPEKPSRTWPRTPRALSGRLRRLAPALRTAGVSVVFEREASTHDRRRLIEITSKPETPSGPAEPSETPSLSHTPSDGRSDGRTVASDGSDGSRFRPSDDLRRQHALSDGSDGSDDVITPALEDKQRGSLAWLATARLAEVEAWERELQAAAKQEGDRP